MLLLLDHTITIIFVAEILTWSISLGFRNYISNGWNKFDFTLVLISVISLGLSYSPFNLTDISFLLVLRVARLFKMFRFLKFIPNINSLINGIQRALKASVLVLVALVVYIFMIAVLSTYLFSDVSPDFFGDPFKSLYSIFRVFTIEGWFEIPDAITVEKGPMITIIVNLFFVFILTSGGILGISLVNSIFVDAMISDNNDNLELKVDELSQKIESLSNQINQFTINK